MIVEWGYSIFTNIAAWGFGLVPGVPAGTNPAGGITAILGPVMGQVSNLGAWMPWDVINIVVPISIALYLGSLVVRAVKSFIPTISG